MTPAFDSFYADWRVRCGAVRFLREDDQSPPEQLLQAIWQHQRLLRDELKTLDGEPVRLLHPGFRSVEGGPDFRGAVLQFGDRAPQSGDVEVDIRASGWRSHGHDRNPAFGKVILHVVWDCDKPLAGAPPALRLRGLLDAPLGELSLWLGTEAAQLLPESLRGRCCAPLKELQAGQLTALLHQAAKVRLQSKAAQFQARARQVGWEQSLWEGVFRALGYKHNVWPMQRLGELRSRWSARPGSRLAIQARLFGIGNLIPLELGRSTTESDGYARRVWDLWWREREAFEDCILPRTLWRFHGLRPANHPQRRLALASCWSERVDLPLKLERWCAQKMSGPAVANSLAETLQVEADDFWSWHCTFSSARFKAAQPLLGATRVTDLAVNVVLPWLWIRAVDGQNQGVRASLEAVYFGWPAAQDNAVLRLARQRLLGESARRSLGGAAAQQGLMQLVHDFCANSNAICSDCHLPKLVREFAWSDHPGARDH